ncbi:hypothetical protein D3C73_765150 [compost metagenome]
MPMKPSLLLISQVYFLQLDCGSPAPSTDDSRFQVLVDLHVHAADLLKPEILSLSPNEPFLFVAKIGELALTRSR